MIIAYFDGSCDPNPGGRCTYGVAVFRGPKKIHEDRGLAVLPGPGATNNVAEYTGCIRALEWLQYETGPEPRVLRGDSELVINQLKGRYRVRSPLLTPLYERARTLLAESPSVRLEWIPRTKNIDADRLAGIPS